MQHFLKSETGAVTVDWVVLTAGLVGLGMATMAVVSTGVQDTSNDIDGQLTGQRIFSSFNASNYTPFYDAAMRQNEVGISPVDFEPTVAVFKAMDDATLVNNIQIAEAGYAETVARSDALNALDNATVTAADIAAALGGEEAAIQAAIDSNFGGSASDLHAHLGSHFNYSARVQEFRKTLADERGLSY